MCHNLWQQLWYRNKRKTFRQYGVEIPVLEMSLTVTIFTSSDKYFNPKSLLTARRPHLVRNTVDSTYFVAAVFEYTGETE